MLISTLRPRGELNIKLFGPDGELKLDRTEYNKIVDVGLAYITSRMIGTASTVMSHMAVGTTNTAPAAGNTILAAQHADGRRALDNAPGAQSTTTGTNDSVTYICTFPAGNSTGALVEAGIFNDVSAGTMLARTTFGTITKGASDSLVITWKIVMTSAT